MKIAIYQIDSERDENRIKFEGFEDTTKYQNSSEIDSSIYDKIFEGSTQCKTLDDVFSEFNLNPPKEFGGHALSVSDVVEVIGECEPLVGRIRFYNDSANYEKIEYTDSAKYNSDIYEANNVGRCIVATNLEGKNIPAVENGFYFCDNIGFKKIDFQKPEPQKNITVVLVKPNQKAQIATIDASLRGLQEIVKGPIEAMYPFEEEVCIVCNEVGKIEGLPLSRAIYDEDKQMIDIIAGTFFICDASGEDFGSLNEEQQNKYLEQFKSPERFYKFGDVIKAVPYKIEINKSYER